MKQSIIHIALVVRDYDEAIEFFTRKLRFTLVEDSYQPEQNKRWVVITPPESTRTTLLLARASTPEQTEFTGNQAGGRVFLFLETDDFWRDYNEMKSLGIKFEREPKEETYGTVAVFKDLYGNLWDLIERGSVAKNGRFVTKTGRLPSQAHTGSLLWPNPIHSSGVTMSPRSSFFGVRWYLRYALSYRDLEEMMNERGLALDHTTIYRWVQRYAPELEKRSRPHLRPTNDSYRVDETYVKIKGKWYYLYRAVDSTGQTIDFMLSAKRDADAAKRFFRKMLRAPKHQSPQVINVDQNRAYPPAVEELKEEGVLPIASQLRLCKYLNNIIEQDHRFIKRRVNPGLGFFSFNTARRTIGGYEVANMIRKGQVEGIGKGGIRGQVRLVESLFKVAA